MGPPMGPGPVPRARVVSFPAKPLGGWGGGVDLPGRGRVGKAPGAGPPELRAVRGLAEAPLP